ncbi:hypothetical protein DFH27DRAFT_537380 [Peziza echinospora]|nr:hypothetical protein DFH27DRAFT_537380 [Peziza echinospora]
MGIRVSNVGQIPRFRSIAYSLLASIFTTVFLTITTAFFKAVYPPQNPVSSGFRELRLGEKANIVGNFTSALIWIAALGLMIAELWELGRIADDRKGDEKRLAQSVESDERLWARMGLTVFVMLGLLVLGWYSMQRVWRRDRHGNLSDSRVEMLGRW